MSVRPEKRAKHGLALLACGLWLLGFDLLPALHLAFHEQFGAHQHGAHEPAHHEPSAAEHDDERDGPQPTDSEHGEGSLAHHDLAAHGSPASLPALRQAPLAWTEMRPRIFEEDPSRIAERPARARDPPSSSRL